MQTYWIFISLGSLLSLIGYIWLTVVGFKRSVLWGVLVLLFSPLSAIIFAVLNWREARYAFLVYAVSMVMIFGTFYSAYSRYSPLFQQAMEKVQNGELSQEQAKGMVVYGLLHDKTSLQEVIDEVAPHPKQEGSGLESGDTDNGAGTSLTQESSGQPEEGAKLTEATGSSTDASAEKKSNPAPTPTLAPTPTPAPSLSTAQPDPLAVKKPKLPPKTVVVSLSRVSHYVGHYFIIKLKNGNERRGLLVKVESSRLILDRKLYGGNFSYHIRKNEIKSLHMLRNPPKER